MSWIIYAFLSAVSASAVAIFAKIGLEKADPILATTIRSVVMASVLLVSAFFLGKFELMSDINSKTLFYVVLSGLAGVVSWIFYFYAIKGGPATSVTAIDHLSVVFVLVLAALFLGENISIRSGLGAVLISIGATLMTLK